MDIWTLARRNVWRNSRRTGITVAAMALALAALLLFVALLEGMLRDMEHNIVALEFADLQVHAKTYLDDPDLYTRIEDSDAVLDQLESGGYRASARLLGYGLGASEDASAGVSLRGIDVERDARVSRIDREVQTGSWLGPSDHRGVVLGRRLARALLLAPGDEILVLSQGTDGSMAYDEYEIRGILRGIGDATDRSAVFMTEVAFRELMGMPSGVHQILVRGPSGPRDTDLADPIQTLRTQYDVKTWRQLNPTLSGYVDSAGSMIYIVLVIVYIAVAILVLNAMLMVVFERVREIGVLKALGLPPSSVMGLLFLESGIQLGLAIVIGLAVATPALIYLTRVGVDVGSLAGVTVMGVAMNTVWKCVVTPSGVILPVVLLSVMVFLAVLYPALKAAMIEPVDAIHHH